MLAPALTAVKAVACKQTKPPDTCPENDRAFEVLHTYFYKIMEFNKIPYVDFLTPLVEHSKEKTISSLFIEDILHYSPKGNYILAQTIAKRLATDFDLNNPEPFSLS